MTLTYENLDGIIQVSGINGEPKDGIIDIPGICNLGPVKKIKDNAFQKNQLIKKVFIGNGIEIIGEEAFYLCEKIEHIVIPETVTCIKGRVFRHHGNTIMEITCTVIFEGQSRLNEVGCYTFTNMRNIIIYYCGENSPSILNVGIFDGSPNKIIYSSTISSFCGANTTPNPTGCHKSGLSNNLYRTMKCHNFVVFEFFIHFFLIS